MTPQQFTEAIHALGFPSPYAATAALGVSAPQAWRYAAGKSRVPDTLAKLIEMYLRHGIPEAAE
jgi:hypothetical protein